VPNSPRKSEIKIKARAVSRGIAVGRAVCLFGRKRQFCRLEIGKDSVAREVRRFNAALRLAKRQIRQLSANGDRSRSGIFDTHLLILDDRSFIEKVETEISDRRVNAEWAVKTVTEGYITGQKAAADPHIREKYIDLEDITDRILTALGGGRKAAPVIERSAVVVARELRPSTLIELADSEPSAVITENGGWTSHTFILARELGIPAVTGVRGVLRSIRNGDWLIVDGFEGTVTVNPEENERRRASAARPPAVPSGEPDTDPGVPLKTLDGREIAIFANIDLPSSYARAKKFGASGVGLYRSEFLFNQFKVRAYARIADEAGGDPVRIRTFDLSADQLAAESAEKEKNPALGLRAIRLMLSKRREFAVQLRALLQASAGRPIDIVLPMVSDVGEVVATRSILERERAALVRRGTAVGTPRLGAMIEVPAAVLVADELAREVDFFCLGTNDLVQYLLAVDRDNAGVADWFRTLHPAVLRAVRAVLNAAAKSGIPLVVCGEMAGSPVYAALLVGLGANALSMNINSMPRIRRTISGIAFEEARQIVGDVLGCSRADDAEDEIRRRFSTNWKHLFSPDLLPPRRN
jgi:phosphotransferase system enzyme I (PtsI)